ncbi:MAG: hypothetical protein QGH51_01645 [Planctomycetota bacterium]|jgi:hypothetical protein|nr:hypothetical protein [Planctomycetota bacterium]MDP6940704.1 hypothetical protein [Planctomycetota bacterium]
MNTSDSLAMGHLHLRWSGNEAIPGGCVSVELAKVTEWRERWESEGALSVVQAISPLSALPLEERNRLAILASGPGAALAGLVAEALGCSRVDLVLHPNDQEAYQTAGGRATLYSRLEEVPDGRFFHHAFQGCGLEEPNPADSHLHRRRLKPEGTLTLFGFPDSKLLDIFQTYSKLGLSLRGSGFNSLSMV